LKQLHKLIMTSTAYANLPAGILDATNANPENRLYWRQTGPTPSTPKSSRCHPVCERACSPTRCSVRPCRWRPDVHGQIVVGLDKTEGDNKMPVEVPLNGEESSARGLCSGEAQSSAGRPARVRRARDGGEMRAPPSSTVATTSLMR